MKPYTQTGVIGDDTTVEGGIHFGGNKIYQLIQPEEFDEATLKAAEQRLSELPEENVPEPAALPLGSRMAYAHNPLFVGREQDLLSLARKLKGGKSAAIGQIAAITGLGGIGKTQMAIEFVHRYGQYFAGGVYWLNFGDLQAVPAEVAACSRLGEEGFELETQIKSVLSSWQNALPRLLVFDNCEDEELLNRWRPRGGGSRVLVTSRRQSWGAALSIDTLHLGVLERAESIAMLRKFSAQINEDETSAIANELGDLPLALHLAGSFLSRYADVVSPSSYLQQMQDKELLEHESLKGRGASISPTAHELHVARTFALSYEKLDESVTTDRIAIALLCRTAAFAPGVPIAKQLLFKTLVSEDEDIEPLKQVDGLERLLSLGLIEAKAVATVVLHRLLKLYVNALSADNDAQASVESALLDESRKINRSAYPRELVAWQQHLRAVTDQAVGRGNEGAACLCNEMGYHLQNMGDYDGARPYYIKALEIRKKELGEEHPDTASSLNNIGALLDSIGEYEGARPYYEKALEIRKKVLGEEHPDTANSLNNIGALLDSIGEYEGARPYYEKALEIRKKVLGEEQSDTAISLNNMGELLQNMGDYDAAWPYYEKALEICKKVLGEEHPHTAQILINLGTLFYSTGDYDAARPCYEKALEIRKKGFGEEHPQTAICLNNIGALLDSKGDYDRARLYYEKADSIFVKSLGADHPNTIGVKKNLENLNLKI